MGLEDTAVGIPASHPIIWQAIENMHWGRTAISKARNNTEATAGILKGWYKSLIPIAGADATCIGKAMILISQ